MMQVSLTYLCVVANFQHYGFRPSPERKVRMPFIMGLFRALRRRTVEMTHDKNQGSTNLFSHPDVP